MRRRSALVMALVSVVAVGQRRRAGGCRASPRSPTPSPIALVSPAPSPTSGSDAEPDGRARRRARRRRRPPLRARPRRPTPTASPDADADPDAGPRPRAADRPAGHARCRQPPSGRGDDRRPVRCPAAIGFQRSVGRLAGAGRGRHPALHADLPGPGPERRSDPSAAPATTTSPGLPSRGRSTPTSAGHRRRSGRSSRRARPARLRRRPVPLGRAPTSTGSGPAVRAAQRLHRRQAAAGRWRPGSAPRTTPIQPAWNFAPGCAARRAAGRRGDLGRPTTPTRSATRTTAPPTPISVRSPARRQKDAATGKRVAPKNVVIMRMSFGPLNDGHPAKLRLEAEVIGSGKAWIATNGKTIAGTWKKTAPDLTDPVLRRPGKPGDAHRRPDVHPGDEAELAGVDQGWCDAGFGAVGARAARHPRATR